MSRRVVHDPDNAAQTTYRGEIPVDVREELDIPDHADITEVEYHDGQLRVKWTEYDEWARD